MWKVAWTAPPAPEGHDGARVLFEIPTAPTEPRLAGAAESATTLTTLRRSAERDELELVRAHVPRGEAVMWAARIDPKAFPRVTSPDLRPPPPAEIAPPSAIASNLSRALVAAGFAVLTGLLVLLLRTKQSAVRDAAAMKKAKARPLIPLPWGTGPFVYGVVTSAALASLLWWNPIAGALMVSVAMALAAHRAPSPIASPRRPGEWREASDQEVLLAPPHDHRTALPTDAFDFGTTRGKLCLLLVGLLLGGLGYALRTRIPQIAIAVPLVAVALVPIFVTGTRAQMSESAIELAARVLRPTRDLIAKSIDLTHVIIAPMARTTPLTGAIDEVRLSCTPRDRMPGLKSIEVAIASSCFVKAALPEVLVRFEKQSSTADRLARVAKGTASVVGRSSDERVLRLIPKEPTPRSTASLVSDLMMALEGRRATDRSKEERKSAGTAWRGPERRGVGRVLVPA